MIYFHLNTHLFPDLPSTVPMTLESSHFSPKVKNDQRSSVTVCLLSKRQASVETLEPILILPIFTLIYTVNDK